jgi:hypothetical protein
MRGQGNEVHIGLLSRFENLHGGIADSDAALDREPGGSQSVRHALQVAVGLSLFLLEERGVELSEIAAVTPGITYSNVTCAANALATVPT